MCVCVCSRWAPDDDDDRNDDRMCGDASVMRTFPLCLGVYGCIFALHKRVCVLYDRRDFVLNNSQLRPYVYVGGAFVSSSLLSLSSSPSHMTLTMVVLCASGSGNKFSVFKHAHTDRFV